MVCGDGGGGMCVQRERENKCGKQYLENLDRKGYRKTLYYFCNLSGNLEAFKNFKFKDQE